MAKDGWENEDRPPIDPVKLAEAERSIEWVNQHIWPGGRKITPFGWETPTVIRARIRHDAQYAANMNAIGHKCDPEATRREYDTWRLDSDQVATALAFLRLLRPTRGRTADSYMLKHRAETWGSCTGMASYVREAALITAVLVLEYPFRPASGGGSGGGWVGVSQRDLRRVMLSLGSYGRASMLG